MVNGDGHRRTRHIPSARIEGHLRMPHRCLPFRSVILLEPDGPAKPPLSDLIAGDLIW